MSVEIALVTEDGESLLGALPLVLVDYIDILLDEVRSSRSGMSFFREGKRMIHINPRFWMNLIRFVQISIFVIAFIATVFSASNSLSLLLFYLKYLLVAAPQVLDLCLILLSFYLMLSGVWRWGHRQEGAFSRSLIGLFVLHTSSVELPFVPYLALFLELILCYRNYTAGRVRGQSSENESSGSPESSELGYSLQG